MYRIKYKCCITLIMRCFQEFPRSVLIPVGYRQISEDTYEQLHVEMSLLANDTIETGVYIFAETAQIAGDWWRLDRLMVRFRTLNFSSVF